MSVSVKLEEGMKVQIASKTATRTGKVGVVERIDNNLSEFDFPVEVKFKDGEVICYAFNELAVLS
jgi:uncharacterized protein YwbE